MSNTVLKDLFGGKAAEAVLLALYHEGEAYGRAVARDFNISVDSIQKQFDRFEKSGVMVCKRVGRTLVYRWNAKSRAASRLRELVGVAYDGLSLEKKQSLFAERRQPRAKDKPVIRRGRGT